MPLWNIYHPVGAYTADEKRQLAAAIVPLYPILPKFYVGVLFHELADVDFFVGGVATKGFVRIAVDHIARQFPNDEIREKWLGMATAALTPFTADRGFQWEMHVDETPSNIWLIQGMRPPSPDTEQERLWIERNEPVPYSPDRD